MLLLLVTTLTMTQEVGWQPPLPRQGSLIVVSAPDAITGEVAGEALHFRDGRALAAVPLGTADSIAV
ncbi:MAG: hypothetical protein ABR537_00705, partial [Gemmatimonadales bacterium]